MGSIKIIRSGKVKRAKLYYLRDRKGKSARIAEKIKKNVGIEVEVKSSTPTKSSEEIVSDTKEETKSTTEKKITEKKETKKSDNLK